MKYNIILEFKSSDADFFKTRRILNFIPVFGFQPGTGSEEPGTLISLL
jgi:hypothetical protein